MIASLPMYDTPQTASANNKLWQAIRNNYQRGPETLDHEKNLQETWRAPDLVLSQTCGLPYRSGLHRSVQLVGTPDYGVTGCPPGYYRSCIVVRADDSRATFTEFQGARLARNDIGSQSGWAAILEHARALDAEFQFDDDIVETGCHAESARTVAKGIADIAAVDAVTWKILRRDDPAAARLRVLEETRPTPGLPFIAGKKENAPALFDAIKQAIATLGPEDRHCLLLNDIVFIPRSAYLEIPLP